MYPLYYAATKGEEDLEIHEKLIKVLVDHGADPYARYEQTTVMHQIINFSYLTRLFLDLPSLDLESRDSSGLTLFLITCRAGLKKEAITNRGGGKYSLIGAFLSQGRNALHFLLKLDPSYINLQALRPIATEAPDLINSAANKGNTPFHSAIVDFAKRCQCCPNKEVEALISAGVDVSLANKNGDTPLQLLLRAAFVEPGGSSTQMAPSKRTTQILRPLYQNGRRSQFPEPSGETPISEFFREGIVVTEELRTKAPAMPVGRDKEADEDPV